MPRGRQSRGTALVEFGLVALLLFLLLAGILEWGLMFSDILHLQQAARVGARAAAIGDTTSTIRTKIRNATPTLQQAKMVITLRYSTDGGTTFPFVLGDSGSENNAPIGSLIRVHIGYQHQYLTSLVNPGSSRYLSSDVVMQREG